MADRIKKEPDLEQIIGDNQIATPEELLNLLRTAYDKAIGNSGKDIFVHAVIPMLLKKRATHKEAGLEALAALQLASGMPRNDIPSYLGSFVLDMVEDYGTIAPHPQQNTTAAIEALPSQTQISESPLKSLQSAEIPVAVYSDDNALRNALRSTRKYRIRGGFYYAVYLSPTIKRPQYSIFTQRIMLMMPAVEMVVGAKTANIDGRDYIGGLIGYYGEIDGQRFEMNKGSGPLIICHGVLGNVGYRHSSDKEHGFMYFATPFGERYKEIQRWGNVKAKEIYPALAIFAVLPKQNYEELVKTQFRDIEALVCSILPERPWKDYLSQGGFFSKPRVIGRIV